MCSSDLVASLHVSLSKSLLPALIFHVEQAKRRTKPSSNVFLCSPGPSWWAFRTERPGKKRVLVVVLGALCYAVMQMRSDAVCPCSVLYALVRTQETGFRARDGDEDEVDCRETVMAMR